MSNFYVVLGGHNKVSDAARVNTCRLKFKDPSLKQKVQKKKNLSKTWVSRKLPFEDFNGKRNKINFKPRLNNPVEHTAPKQQLNMALVKSKN